jgi:hypothetical protein
MGSSVGMIVGIIPKRKSPPTNPCFRQCPGSVFIDNVFGLIDNFLSDISELNWF